MPRVRREGRPARRPRRRDLRRDGADPRHRRARPSCHPFDDAAVIAGHGSTRPRARRGRSRCRRGRRRGRWRRPDLGGRRGRQSTPARDTRVRRRTRRSNAVSLAIERGEVVTIQPDSVADGLGAPFAGVLTLAMARRLLDDIVLIDDATILAGLRFALERLKQVVEPAGAAALAAVLAGRIPIKDRRADRRRPLRRERGDGSARRLLAQAGTFPGSGA